MTPRELALALGPYTSFAVKDRFRNLMVGGCRQHCQSPHDCKSIWRGVVASCGRSITLRYDEVTDWKAVHKLIEREDEIAFFDGEEWFRLELRGIKR